MDFNVYDLKKEFIDKITSPDEREWYILQTIQNGWSRNVLEMQIESDLYNRQSKAITNFEKTLPSPQSDLAQQITKDPYVFDFLSLPEKFKGVLPSPEEIEEELSKEDLED